MAIVPDNFYPPKAPEMGVFFKEQTLAAWRHKNKGPAYFKAGGRVFYKGADVLAWLERQKVTPVAA